MTILGDDFVSRRSGRVWKPTTKVEVVQQASTRQDNAEIKSEVQEPYKLVHDLLQRNAEREQLLGLF